MENIENKKTLRRCGNCVNFRGYQCLKNPNWVFVSPVAVAENCEHFVAKEKRAGEVLENREEERGQNALRETARLFYTAGFNVVPVDASKKPLCKWSPERRVAWEELENLLRSATGIAVVGGEIPHLGVLACLIDVDNPDVLERSPTLAALLKRTVSWKTGPRCPSCSEKHVSVIESGKRFKCGKCGAEFGIGEAKRGYGMLVVVERATAEKLGLRGTRRLGDVELLLSNYQLIPPSLHSTGVRYEWVNPPKTASETLGVVLVTEEPLRRIIEELSEGKAVGEEARKEAAEERVQLRELREADLLKIVELLKPVYAPGRRQHIWLYLAGWAAKARISPLSIAKALKMLYESTQDEDSIRTRGSAIMYSYSKAGVQVDKAELARVLGEEPYGPEHISEREVKGKSGLQEILEEVLGEEKALEIIRTLEDIFGAASPYRDSIFEVLDYEKQLYAVANLRKLVVVRARRLSDRMVYKERVTVGAPTSVTVYINPIGGITKYEVFWESATRRPLRIGPALLEEIVDRLRAEGLVLHSRLAGDVIAAVVEGFVRKGKADIKEEIESPGFYLMNNKITAVKLNISTPSVEELREALELLNELAGVWFKHVEEKFATVVLWGVAAPFSYCYKQKGRWLPWLYLYGASRTGKTTLGDIVLAIWGLDSRNTKPGASIDTVARLGHVLSQSTFPVVINEPAGALGKDDIVEMVKSAVERTVARGKYVRGSYVEIPALSPLLFTSNKYVPRDDALLRRFVVLQFTFGERIPEEKAREFEEVVKPRLSKLQAIGRFAASYAVARGVPEDPWEFARNALEAAYKLAGMEPPGWIHITAGGSDPEEIYEDVIERIRAHFIERINEEYARNIGKLVVEREEGRLEYLGKGEASLRERAIAVLEKGLLPWAIARGDTVYITSALLDELRGKCGDMSLKSLAELLGWNYIHKKTFRFGKTVITKTVVETPLENFLSFITPEEVREEKTR